MKILKHKENYIKLEMADGKIIVIDNSDREYEIEEGDGDSVNINIYSSSNRDAMFTPIASLEYNEEGSKYLHMPEECIVDDKVRPFSPPDAYDMTAKEFWEDIRAERAVKDLLK